MRHAFCIVSSATPKFLVDLELLFANSGWDAFRGRLIEDSLIISHMTEQQLFRWRVVP